MKDHRSYIRNLSSCEIKPEKNSGLNGIQTHDLCDTGAALHQLSHQANWESMKRLNNARTKEFVLS